MNRIYIVNNKDYYIYLIIIYKLLLDSNNY